MKKLKLTLFVVISLWINQGLVADYPLDKGLYISENCNVSIDIEHNTNNMYYTLIDHKDTDSHKIEATKEGRATYITFKTLNKVYYNDADLGVDMKRGDSVGETQALLNNSTSFTIQNYGNAMNPYITFDGCGKYIDYQHLESINKLEQKLKNAKSVKKFNDRFAYRLLRLFHPNTQNVESYNNIAFYLQQHKADKEALILLHDILLNFPDRTVAHYNYAQSTQKLKQSEDTKNIVDEHLLSYIAQMMLDKKEHKIPKEINQEYNSYYLLLKQINEMFGEKYQVLGFAKGDINEDKTNDFSIVIELANSDKIKNKRGLMMRPENSNKRIWLLFTGNNKGYKLLAKNDVFIEPDEYTNCDDNFDSLEIKNNSLYLHTHYWCSSGGWEMGRDDYQFVYRKGSVILAGIESQSTHRASAEGKDISINFLSKRMKTQHTIDMGDPKGKPIWKQLNLISPIQFDELSRMKLEKFY